MEKQRILIVEDENVNIDILMKTLGTDYKITVAKNGQQALARAVSNPPDLVLLDIMLPDMNGYDVCEQLKKMPHMENIPIVFVTAMDSESYEYRGLEIGAIDYITKPIHPGLVKVRVSNHLRMRSTLLELERLNQLALDSNPITGLPGNNSIAEAVGRCLQQKSGCSVLYADLDNFKAFNDTYGFARGDNIIRFTSDTLKKSVASVPESFLGHVGGDDFVLIVPNAFAEQVLDDIITTFDEGIPSFYDAQDREKGCIATKDRAGNDCTYPFISISIGVVDLSRVQYESYIEVNDACAEVKKAAKRIPGSSVYFNKRSEVTSS